MLSGGAFFARCSSCSMLSYELVKGVLRVVIATVDESVNINLMTVYGEKFHSLCCSRHGDDGCLQSVRVCSIQ